MYWNIAPLRSARIILSNESSFAQNWFWTRELCPFHPSTTICPDEFQNAQRPMFLPYLLVRVFKFIVLDALEREFHEASEYQLFLPCTSLSMCKIRWKQQGLLSNFGDVDEFDFFFDHEFMGTLCHAFSLMRSHGPSCKRWRCSIQLLFHFPCWTWSITLNGKLAQSSLTSWSPHSLLSFVATFLFMDFPLCLDWELRQTIYPMQSARNLLSNKSSFA